MLSPSYYLLSPCITVNCKKCEFLGKTENVNIFGLLTTKCHDDNNIENVCLHSFVYFKATNKKYDCITAGFLLLFLHLSVSIHPSRRLVLCPLLNLLLIIIWCNSQYTTFFKAVMIVKECNCKIKYTCLLSSYLFY